MSNETRMCGDYAKLREALSDACYAMFNFLKTQSGGYEEMANALDKAKAALATTSIQNKQEDKNKSRKSKSSMPNANSKWNDDEQRWYRQFIESGTVEQLAYTAVQEAYLRRKATEELNDKEKRITAAIKKMCLGLSMLQDELGIDIHKMAVECVEEELNKILGTPEERFARNHH